MCAHARAACNVWSAGGTNTVNLYVFLPVCRENGSTSWFSTSLEFPRKVKVFLPSGVKIYSAALVLRCESCSLYVNAVPESVSELYT